MFPKVFARPFSVWRYIIGHGQLLLRSPKDDELALATRVDVGFKNVGYIQLPMDMSTLAIRIGSLEDLPEDLRKAMDLPDGLRNVLDMRGRQVYVLDAGGVKGLVVAGYAGWHEDEGEYHEPSAVLQWIMEGSKGAPFHS